MIRVFVFLIFSLTVNAAAGQKVKGYVRDANSDETLVGVSVFSNDKNVTKGVLTDTAGYYEITLPDGGGMVNFSYVGYEPQAHPLVVRKNTFFVLDIYLDRQVELMSEVVVSAGRFDQKLSEITVSMEVVKAEDISKQNATDLSVVLNTLSGVDVTDRQPSIRGGSGWTYGVGSRSLVLVDGMSILTPAVGEVNWNVIPMENVAQVEVLKGASSVLYGSSALNGLINVRTARPGLKPQTNVNVHLGAYMDPKEKSYIWWEKNNWKSGKFEVEPMLRKNVLAGIRNPIYTGTEVSHTRRIGNFDVSAGLDLFTDEGYRQGNFNQRVRFGGNVTYHDKTVSGLNYGVNANLLSNNYSGFFIWRSAEEPYVQSPLTNMSRQGNMFYIDPFLNYFNSEKNVNHRIKARYLHKSEGIVSHSTDKPITDILNNMGFNYASLPELAGIIANPGSLEPILLPGAISALLSGDFTRLAADLENFGRGFFPNATAPDLVDLISWTMARTPLPTDSSQVIPWLLNSNKTKNRSSEPDNTSSYYIDYQFNKKLNNAQFTTGATFEHIANESPVTGSHVSDNIAAFFQYDQKFLGKLNVSAGMRLEYYRVDSLYKEAQTNIFGWKAPFKPVLRGGLNYELAPYSFIRASIGQGYRYPSLTEKFVFKDIGGIAAYPNRELKPESGFNAEVGIKQGYKIGNFAGFVDLAGFYTQYRDMIEFQFGLFNNTTFEYIENFQQIMNMIAAGQMPGLGTRFSNVERAQIYGLDFSITGIWTINPAANVTYNLGYVFINPIDPDWEKKNATEEANADLLAMKEKSNTSKYLKYRQKHSFKGVLDFNWSRFSIGTNLTYKSKTLAVDYFMADEREKNYMDMMDLVRSIIFPGLHDYWKAANKGYFAMDARLGVKVTKGIQFWMMLNNALNKEYSLRPMDVSAPRTLVLQVNAKL